MEENEHFYIEENPNFNKSKCKFLHEIRRRWKLLIILILVIAVYLVYWFDYVPLSDLFYQPSTETPIILYWTSIFGVPFHDYIMKKSKKNMLADCPYKCIFTDDRKDMNPSDLPKRKSSQLNVFFNQESPSNSGDAYQRVPRNFFDLTMTYRLDSDIPVPYDYFSPIDNDTSAEEVWQWREIVKKVNAKSEPVLQFVSNCHTASKREAYVEKLKRYIKVTSIGQCNNNQRKCGRSSSCEETEIDKHFFYLAFENSVCKDYVTEKFWRLKNLIVPVILDGQIYKGVVPAGTYIATTDFDSPSDLANYLTHLTTNTTEYLKYFKWTKKYTKKNTRNKINSYCEMCRIAHTQKQASITDINDWWNKQSQCQKNFGLNRLGIN